MRRMAGPLLGLLVLAAAAAGLAACNTVAGFGEDMSQAAQAITSSAQRLANSD